MKRIFKSIGISLVSVIALLLIVYLLLPKGPRDLMPFQGLTQTADQLTRLGYQLQQDPKWDKDYGAVGAILRTDEGKILAAADPREETLADGK